MALKNLTDREAVLRAIAEYDALGQAGFLEKYGYRRSTEYLLQHDGKAYNSKAIVGVAHGFQYPDKGPLTSDEFAGGSSTVEPLLKRLGFEVVRVSEQDDFIITEEDITLLRASRTTVRYADLRVEQLEAYRRIHGILQNLGNLLLEHLGVRRAALKLTSGFNPVSGVRGALPKDLWFSISGVGSDIGMPQLFMIVSTRGIEYGYAPAIHPSDFSNSDIKQKVREAAPKIFASLPAIESHHAQDLERALKNDGGWYYRRKTRLDPNEADFPSLASWLEFLKSPAGTDWAGGSISKYLTVQDLSRPPVNLSRVIEKLADTFGNWIGNTAMPPEPVAPDSIRLGIEEFLSKQPIARSTVPFGQHYEVKALMRRIRDGIEGLAAVRRHPHIKVSWSLGAGNWAKIPWIALMDDRVTDSTQRGIYIVFLFREDMSGVYLTLNQGITDLIAAEGRAPGLVKLQEEAHRRRAKIGSLREIGYSLDNQIDLKTDGVLGQGYQTGTIAYKLYRKANVPNDPSLERDLAAVLDAYAEIVGEATAPALLPDEPEITPSGRVWVYAPGRNAEFWDDFYEQGIIAIGWDNLGSLAQYGSVEELVSALDTHYPTDSRQSNNARTCFDFFQTMHPGDLVFVKRGRSLIIGHGIVIGEYTFDDSRPNYKNVRKMRWESRGQWSSPDTMALKTLTEITDYPDFVEKLKQLVAISPVEPPAPLPSRDREVYDIDDAMSGLFMPRNEFERALRIWRSKKNLILQGAPGVGKSFVAKRLAYTLMGYRDPTRVRTVQFHQSYSYEDFIQGYRPDGQRGFELKPGVFLEFCEKARVDPDETYVFIIDEINRGNLSRIFGELMLLIEPDKRSPDWATKLAYAKSGEERFYVPSNVHILGLMNTADRSLSLVDYALRRRFGFISLFPQYEQPAFRQELENAGCNNDLVARIIEKLSELNREIAGDRVNLGPGFCIGHSFFVPSNRNEALDQRWFEEVIETEIRPLLEEYWSDDPDHAERARGRLLTG